MSHHELLDLSRELTRQRQPHAWITVIGVTAPSSSYVGAQAIVKASGEMRGWIGGGCVQSVARVAALRSMASGAPQRLRLSNTQDPSEAVDVRPMSCASNGEVELFIQPSAVAPRLRIYGSTPIGRIAAWLACEAGFDTSTDDVDAAETQTYALICTQGDGDEAALEAALRSRACAILVIASRRKAERLRTAMALRGISEERLEVVHAPAGPDIGAVTPGEIAVAAIAGLVALRRGRPEACARRAGTGGGLDADREVQIGAVPVTGYINPVCGAVVDPAHALSTVTRAGQTHYFCCQACRTEFDRDPEKYLQIAARMRPPACATHP